MPELAEQPAASQPSTPAAEIAPQSPAAASSEFIWSGKEGKLSDGWADHLPAEMKPQASAIAALVDKYQGNIPQLLKGALNLQTVAGRKMGAPQADWTPEQVSEYRLAHEVPESADKYDLTPAEGALPEGVTWNPEVFAPIKNWAHKNHVSAAALKEWTGIQASVDRARQQAAIDMVNEADTKTIADLKKEFGESQFDKSVQDGFRAAKFFGVETDPNKNPIANHPEFIKFAARVAKQMGESKLATITSGASEQPGKLRATEIMNPNGQDPLTADYHGKNGYEKQAAAQRVLHDLMATG